MRGIKMKIIEGGWGHKVGDIVKSLYRHDYRHDKDGEKLFTIKEILPCSTITSDYSLVLYCKEQKRLFTTNKPWMYEVKYTKVANTALAREIHKGRIYKKTEDELWISPE